MKVQDTTAPTELRVELLDTLSPVVPLVPGRPSQGAVGAGPTSAIPQDDPIEAQRILCLAATLLVREGPPELAQLDELFALDRQGQSVSKLLLTRYIEGDSKLRTFDWRSWQAAIRLCQAFYQAHEHFIQHIRSTKDADWIRHEPLVRIQMFHHRKVEFLLRFFRYKKRNAGQWKELHAMYLASPDVDLSRHAEAHAKTDTVDGTSGKLKQQYLQILLMEVMNSGEFSPREAWWAHRWFERWCGGPGLQLTRIAGCRYEDPGGFVVDPSGSDGLKRAPVAGDDLLHFDPSPLRAMIDQEMASLHGGAAPLLGISVAVRVGQLALLNKLAALFAPTAPDFEERGERKAVDLTVQAIAGFPFIVDELRREKQRQSGGSPQSPTPGGETTVSPFGMQTQSPIFAGSDDNGPVSLSMTALLAAIPQTWQVKDRSDSGCRMRGQVDNLNRVIPGSLIAVRDSATAPWIVSVVRRFRRLMVDHVEISVEHLGRKPRYVKLVADGDQSLVPNVAPDKVSRCFAALYLPPSDQFPIMPIKTLLLPAREFKAGSVVTLLSSNATYRMRLNEAIQQQFEFVLTSFSVVEKSAPQASTTR